MELNRETRKIWAEKTFELTNIAAGVLFFGQFVAERPVQTSLLFAGILFMGIGYLASFVIIQKL